MAEGGDPSIRYMVRVSLVGTPNTGKSSIANALVGRPVCPVSSKVHTTRGLQRAVFTSDTSQLVLVDSPGLIPASRRTRHQIERTMVSAPLEAASSADVVAVVVDVTQQYFR